MRTRKLVLFFAIITAAFFFLEGAYLLNALNNEYRKPVEGGNREKAIEYEDKEFRYNELEIGHNDKKEEEREPRLNSGTASEKPVNLLLLGLDHDEKRTDVIWLLNFSPENHKLNILSIARDTSTFVRGRRVKINALYGMGGVEMAIRRVEMITGLPIDYYVTLNLEAFRKIVDLFGGVEFYVPFRMDYDDASQNLHIHLEKGLQVLDGEKAEQLIRYRKGNTKGEGYEDGDIGRIKMQQDFVKAFLRQKLKLRYITKVDDIFLILRKYFRTNVGLQDINRHIGSVSKLETDNINTFTIPGDSVHIDGAWYFIYNKKKTREIINTYFFR